MHLAIQSTCFKTSKLKFHHFVYFSWCVPVLCTRWSNFSSLCWLDHIDPDVTSISSYHMSTTWYDTVKQSGINHHYQLWVLLNLSYWKKHTNYNSSQQKYQENLLLENVLPPHLNVESGTTYVCLYHISWH